MVGHVHPVSLISHLIKWHFRDLNLLFGRLIIISEITDVLDGPCLFLNFGLCVKENVLSQNKKQNSKRKHAIGRPINSLFRIKKLQYQNYNNFMYGLMDIVKH